MLLARFLSSANALARVRTISANVERIADIICEPVEWSGVEGTSAPAPHAVGRITLSDVRYAYSPTDPAVLKGIDLDIEPGECVAIVGASGCGKTTLLKVVAGLLQPSTGSLTIDGQALNSESLRPYRSGIAAVMQNDQLFAGSVLENICYPDEKADEERLQRALAAAAIDKELRAFPMGLNTPVGDMGSVLSAGQRQRVLIARALYRNPTFLFLDEATGNLDPASEIAVVDAIGRLGITRLVVTHRPEILRIANRIAALRDGTLHWLPMHEIGPPPAPVQRFRHPQGT
jgi:ATP-binding cassette subfamily B protein RaxB